MGIDFYEQVEIYIQNCDDLCLEAKKLKNILFTA